jgi:hypothetical protein
MEQIIKDDTWKTIVLISSGSKYWKTFLKLF